MAGNPWWSEPGWTLDGIPKDREGATAGRHAGKLIGPSRPPGTAPEPRHAGQEPQQDPEPDPAAPAPVPPLDHRPTLADITARSPYPSFRDWLAAHRATVEVSGEARPPHYVAALRRLAASRWRVVGVVTGSVVGPAVGEVASGTETTEPLHRTGGDEDPDRTETQDAGASSRPSSVRSATPGHQPDPDHPQRRRDSRE